MLTGKPPMGLYDDVYPIEREEYVAPLLDAVEQGTGEEVAEWAGRLLVITLSVVGIAVFAFLVAMALSDSVSPFRETFQGLADADLPGLFQCPLH